MIWPQLYNYHCMDKEQAKKGAFREFRKDTFKLALLRLVLVGGFSIPFIIFWGKGPTLILAFFITLISWYKYWKGKVDSVLADKWEYVEFETGELLSRREKGKVGNNNLFNDFDQKKYDPVKETIKILISHKGMKPVFLFLLGLTIIVIIGLTYIFVSGAINNKVQPTKSPIVESDVGKMYVDLDGNGIKDSVVYKIPKDQSNPILDSIIAYDHSGKELAKLPENLPVRIPMSDSFRVYKPEADKNREIFSLDFLVGPHQAETMFFEIQKKEILPVCFTLRIVDLYDCMFYSGNVGVMIVKDLNNDGYLDIVEIVDEYPNQGKLSVEEESAISLEFKEQGIPEFTENAKEIAMREKGGRGRNVVWGIYTYNGKYFAPQVGAMYEILFSFLVKESPEIVRRSDISKESQEYVEFVRNLW